MTDDTRRLILSVRPRFAEAILSGAKTVELRRTRPVLTLPTEALIYASSPQRCLVGQCQVLDVVGDTPRRLWRRYARQASVTRSEFDQYFAGASTAYALLLADPRSLEYPLTLDGMRRTWTGFQPPQSFRYVSVPVSDRLLAAAC